MRVYCLGVTLSVSAGTVAVSLPYCSQLIYFLSLNTSDYNAATLLLHIKKIT